MMNTYAGLALLIFANLSPIVSKAFSRQVDRDNLRATDKAVVTIQGYERNDDAATRT